jgi:hypothetical protein
LDNIQTILANILVAFRPNLFAPAKTELEGEQQSLQTDKQTTFKLDPRKKNRPKIYKKVGSFQFRERAAAVETEKNSLGNSFAFVLGSFFFFPGPCI